MIVSRNPPPAVPLPGADRLLPGGRGSVYPLAVPPHGGGGFPSGLRDEIVGPVPGATPRSTLVRYALFQIPEWVLVLGVAVLLYRRGLLPGWAGGLLVAASMAKDAALYPLLRTAYETDTSSAIERLIGLRGVAVETLAPRGYVRVHGELWKSEATAAGAEIPPGNAVTVHAVRGTTLLVRPEPPRNRAPRGARPPAAPVRGGLAEKSAAEGR